MIIRLYLLPPFFYLIAVSHLRSTIRRGETRVQHQAGSKEFKHHLERFRRKTTQEENANKRTRNHHSIRHRSFQQLPGCPVEARTQLPEPGLPEWRSVRDGRKFDGGSRYILTIFPLA